LLAMPVALSSGTRTLLAENIAGGRENPKPETRNSKPGYPYNKTVGYASRLFLCLESLPMRPIAEHLPKTCEFDVDKIIVPPGGSISLKKDYDPDYTGRFSDKAAAKEELVRNIAELTELQERLYANDTYALLLVFQAMDAAGKDGTIKHVMSGINPQGCQVYSFKGPSNEELDHDYLWRTTRSLPERGRIGIFNRSYYEECLVVRVHPELLSRERFPPVDGSIWKQRFKEINSFERYLSQNGIAILKFFLNVSKQEQKKRFLERIDQADKNWKFSAADIRERRYWSQYIDAYEDLLQATSTEWAPWYVIPADHKWFSRLCVSEIIVAALRSLKLEYPKLTAEQHAELLKAKEELLQE
jgi:PPK2 family polyphosphate:nucleotide phosphotransferase